MCKIRLEPLNRFPKSSNTEKSTNTVTTRIIKHKFYQELKHKSSKMFLPKSYCLSSASASLVPSESLANFPDHYLCMQLDHRSTVEEVKVQYRKLRVEYFATQPAKYKQLQAAYSTLVDPETRQEYDAVYRVRIGLSPLPQGSTGIPSNCIEKKETKVERAGNLSVGMHHVSPESAIVKTAVANIEAQTLQPCANKPLAMTTACSPQVTHLCEKEEEEEEEEQQHLSDMGRLEEQCSREEDELRARRTDSNWGLKHFTPIYNPLIGSRPYCSYIPMPEGYKRGFKQKCHRPRYTGTIAALALP
jgi:curved DNA-binding protein CbpA